MSKIGWVGDVNSNSQCKIYRMFKEKLEFESYLTKLKFTNRNHMCKFRCENSQLPTVAERYSNKVYHERGCEVCDKIC